ncbi:glycosyltransferase [Gammaproteobacteria bacterium]|nr:glycosyltransferase [Gammaproteobacteria bacterium]
MKVCVFIPVIIPGESINGGVPKVFLNTVDAFLDAGHSVTCVVHHKSSALIKSLKERKVEKLEWLELDFEQPTLNMDGGGLSKMKLAIKLFFLAFSICKLRLQIKQKFDIVLAHDITSTPYIISFRAPKKIVYLHSYRSFTNKIGRFFLYVSSLICKSYLSPTNDIAKEMQSINSRIDVHVMETPVLTNSIEVPVVKPGIGKLKLGYIGRLSPIKQLEEVIAFVESLISYNLNLELDIWGEPMDDVQRIYKSKISKLIKEKKLDKIIIFKGFCEDPVSTFRRYNYSILFSEGEAIPLSGLESLMAGTPVIGTYVPGLIDLIGQEERGVYVPKNFKCDDLFFKRLTDKDFYMEDYVNRFTFKHWYNSFEKAIL